MPDANGNVIPSRIVEGSAAFESPEPGKRMNLAIAGGTFNVADATCHLICINCCAVTLAILPLDPFCPVGQTLNCSVQGTDCNGTVSAVAATGWSSSNTSVATVTSSGVMKTVSPGKFTLTATFRPVEIWTGRICLLYPQCTTIGVVSANMTVQVPTSLSIVAGTDSTTAEASCTTTVGGKPATGCGITRSFTYQVLDQYGNPIRQAGLQVWDAFGTPSPNPLGMTSFATTCSPPNTGPCGKTTNSSGQFIEGGINICSTVCYSQSNKTCVTGGPSVVSQVVHVGNSQITQTISFYCDHVLVNGH
jgi:hypothetical protein